MNPKENKKISKFLSLILRHKPQTIGLNLDENGWADVDELLQKSSRIGRVFSRKKLDIVVETNDKKRFAFSDDGKRIRANQGHSIEIDLKLEETEPPETLYHGTYRQVVDVIFKDGLKKMQRHHVHLSSNIQTATRVGERRGKAVILTVESGRMFEDGHVFYLSDNGVWLTDVVPPQYLRTDEGVE